MKSATARPSAVAGVRELRRHIALLVSVDPSEAPFLRCYLDLSDGQVPARRQLEARTRTLRLSLSGVATIDFDQAVAMVETALDAIPAAAFEPVA